MSVEVIDAIAASSPAATVAGEVATDATAVSSPAPDVTADPSTAGEPAAESPPTTQDEELAEFKADVAKAHGTEPASSETEAQTEKPDATKTEEPAPDKVKAEDSNALSQELEKSFKDRPEWQALAALKIDDASKKIIRTQLRGIFKRESDLAQAVEAAKPAQEVIAEMFQSVGGNQQGFDNMRRLITSFDQDPAGAVPMLETLLTDAKKRAGLVLQSPELLTEAQTLDQQFKDGVIDQAALDKRKAELLELEQVRTTQRRTQAQSQADRDRQTRAQSQQQLQAAASAINQAEASWVEAKVKSDPDFKAVESLHGAFAKQNALEFFDKQKRMPTAEESVAILDKSLKQAKEEAAKFRPRPRPRQAVTGGSNGSSGNNRQQPASELDEFKADVEASMNRHRR